MTISQLFQELQGLKDYDVMTSRRRYVIENSSFDLAKVFALVQSIIPQNFVTYLNNYGSCSVVLGSGHLARSLVAILFYSKLCPYGRGVFSVS